MPALASPIPHPLTFFDAPDWTRTALEWVVGVDWPEGDEAAMRELADEWRAAGQAMSPLLDDADDAALAAIAANGGPDGEVAAAISHLWRQLGRGDDQAALGAVTDLLGEFGELIDAGANDVESVKIEFYVELGLLLIELITLAATAAVTLGASMAGAAPAMLGTRFAIQQALKAAARRLIERGARKGLTNRLKHAIRDRISRRVRSRLVLEMGEEAVEEAVEETVTSLGTQLYQIQSGNRSGLDGVDLAASAGYGALGGGAGGLASLGRRHAGGLLGSYAEHSLRGAGGEILAEGAIGLVSGQGVSLQSLGMAATSATSGAITGNTHHLATHQLATTHLPGLHAATLSGTIAAAAAISLPDTTAAAAPPADASLGTHAEPVPTPGAEPEPVGAHKTGQDAIGAADGVPAASHDGPPTAQAAPGSIAAAQPRAHAVEAVQSQADTAAQHGVPAPDSAGAADLGLPGGGTGAPQAGGHEQPAGPGAGAPSGRPVLAEVMFGDAGDAGADVLGAATVRDLNLDPADVRGRERARIEAALPQTVLVAPTELRYTQRAAAVKVGQQTSVALETQYALDRWSGLPIHAVRWGDGSLAALDNERLRAARRAGLEAVPVTVHRPAEALADWPHEFTAKQLAEAAPDVDIRRRPDGSLVVGGSVGEIVHPRGVPPRTWGELALFRAARQSSLLPAQLYGTGHEPMLLPPPPSQRVPLGRRVQEALRNLIRGAEAAAPVVEADLRGLGLATPGEPNVMSYQTLADTFLDANDRFHQDLRTFVADHGDRVLRFTVELPGGDGYAADVESALSGMLERGYRQIGPIRNLWADGNPRPGVEATLRTPQGQSFQVRFATTAALEADRRTEGLHELAARRDERPARRVHALLQITAVSRELGLDAVLPRVPAGWPPPHGTSLADWIAANRAHWDDYQAWLDYHGRDLADVVAEFGLTTADLTKGTDGHPARAVLLRALSQRSGLADGRAAGGDRGGHDGSGAGLALPRHDVEPPQPLLGLRPDGSGPDHERPGVPEPTPADRPGPGGDGDPGLHGRGEPAGRGHDPLVLPDAGQPGPELTRTWDQAAHLLPGDGSGYRVHPDEADHLRVVPDAVVRWAARIAPLGMTEQQFRLFAATLADALAARGVTADQVDARLKGSSSEFFSGGHKKMPHESDPTYRHLAGTLRTWFADRRRPQRRPFDSMYRLGIDRDPSDYDVQLSSDAMAARTDQIRRLFFPDSPLTNNTYNFLNKSSIELAFPELYRWARTWERELGREVAPAVFHSAGPPDKSPELSSHFRGTDWVLDLDPEPGDAERARRRAAALTLPEFATAIDRLDTGAVDPDDLVRAVRGNDDVVDVLLDSPTLRAALTDQPELLLRLCQSPQAAAALRRALTVRETPTTDTLAAIADHLRADPDRSHQ
ncbi:hypothetical protein Cs7R123_58020 [Catellatospora sp. TT07R-123]|uniref:WXG100-like domain-containing protein n=1 Tax=Catellatospora sp. TT07R-123 TaxID=2733863 RepID=UPI001B2CFD0A|nr:hypothetical protein [Catellatospora sp. TT07R-123]GHJ48460.1 hypothetical protein Cs7R123_58020 [Catellatospora sp. TT07R-123]